MEITYVAAFLIGIAGSVHCAGMCGGIIMSLSFAVPKGQNPNIYYISYSIARVVSYAIAGGITGFLGAIFASSAAQGIAVLNLISGLFLLALAAYIGQWWLGLTKLEAIGQRFWKLLYPLGKKLVPFRSPFHAMLYGFIWGWLPCGLVYSTLTWSLASGSALDGFMLMLAFGTGTLPATLLISHSGDKLKALLANPKLKQLIALILAIFALKLLIESLPL